MLTDEKIEQIINLAKPFIDSSLDPLCIVDRTNKIVYFNNEFSNLLGTHALELRKGHNFCDLVKMDICEEKCKIMALLTTEQPIITEMITATANNRDLRIKVKATPLYEVDSSAGKTAIGAVIQIKDLSAFHTLQLKYNLLIRSAAEITLKGEEVRNLTETLKKKTG